MINVTKFVGLDFMCGISINFLTLLVNDNRLTVLRLGGVFQTANCVV